jgi:hypothetical protein
MQKYKLGDLIYHNPLASEADIEGWRMEGDGGVSFPEGRMRMENLRDPSEGQKSNFVHWCPETFPDNVEIEWDFYQIREPGLAMLFFAAVGRNGEDVFDPALAPRNGPYGQYNHGDIDAMHIAYFRRKAPSERAFHICQLRKSYGANKAARGPDPLPDAADATPPYHMTLVKFGPQIAFAINDLEILRWTDDGVTWGPVLGTGKIGFRQMAPLVAEYSNLKVHALEGA